MLESADHPGRGKPSSNISIVAGEASCIDSRQSESSQVSRSDSSAGDRTDYHGMPLADAGHCATASTPSFGTAASRNDVGGNAISDSAR